MADDVLSSGPRAADRDEAIAALFYACYPGLVRAGFAVAGDWDVAGRLAQEAFLRLWRRWRWIRDPGAAPAYLRRTVVSLSRATIRDTTVTNSGLEQRITVTAPDAAGRATDVDRAWHQFQLRADAARRGRRRWLAALAAAVAVAGVAVAVPLAAIEHPAASGPGRPGPAAGGTHQSTGTVRDYPGAVVARLPIRGAGMVAAIDNAVWAVAGNRLARIDPATNRITLAAKLPSSVPGAPGEPAADLVAGGGALWLLTSAGEQAGQVLRLDPGTGRQTAVLHLAAGRCSQLSYGGGRLWAACAAPRDATGLLRIDPATDRVDATEGPVAGSFFTITMLAVPRGVWYIGGNGCLPCRAPAGAGRMGGFIARGGRLGPVSVDSSAWPVPAYSFAYDQLVFSRGAVWVCDDCGSGGPAGVGLFELDPVTGKLLHFFNSSSYPSYAGNAGAVAAGPDSLWQLGASADLTTTGVVGISAATGQPIGQVQHVGSCGQPCNQIYFADGSVWVPTQNQLVRIDPAKMPGSAAPGLGMTRRLFQANPRVRHTHKA